jgi:hypothetical protein
VWPEGGAPPIAWVARVGDDGAIAVAEDVPVELAAAGRARYGMGLARRLVLDAPGGPIAVAVERIVDDGPFYLRVVNRVEGPGLSGRGWGEWVRPDRIDRGALRPLVRMRVHRPGGPNSFWLPLFSGPAGGRVRRLLGLEAR